MTDLSILNDDDFVIEYGKNQIKDIREKINQATTKQELEEAKKELNNKIKSLYNV